MATDAGPYGQGSARCVVLAGGRGRRIGGAKATVRLCGRALIDYPIAAAQAAGLTVLVVAKPETDLSGTAADGADVDVLREPEQPTHPLLGLAVALDHLGEPLVVVPCDLPLIPAALLASLGAARAPVVVARGSRIEPLLGRYEPAMAPRLRRAAVNGEGAQEVVGGLGLRPLAGEALDRFGDPDRFLRNVNTRADLAAIEPLLSRARA